MLSTPDSELALRVISRIHPRGDIVGLNIPADFLDRVGLSTWAEVELGDAELAREMISSDHDPVALLAERRRQADAVLGKIVG